MASPDCQVHQVYNHDLECISPQNKITCICCLTGFVFVISCSQVTQVSPDSLVSLVYQEQKVILDSRVSDSLDPQELKVKTPTNNPSTLFVLVS